MTDTDTPIWCGNTLPHPPHHTCHGVHPPGDDTRLDDTLHVVVGRYTDKNQDTAVGRTVYGPTYETSAQALADALHHHWYSIVWEAVPAAGCAELCGDLTPHPGHGDCAGLTVLTAHAAPGFRLPGAHQIPRRDGNRRAVVTLSRDFLAHSFNLPEGIRVVAVGVDEHRDAILLKVEGDDLPETDPLAQPPEFGEATVYQLYGHEGHDWYRVEWTR